MNQLKKYTIPILCLLNILIHLTSISYLEFHRDELLYFSLSNHMDLGYASVPPMISWLAWLAKSLFGFSPFAVKIFPALLSGVFVYLCTLIAKELRGNFYAQVLTAFAIICTPLSLRAFILFQPVPFDIFFWTLTFYVILKYIHTQRDNWLYALGVVLGLAVLNKYLILFLLFSLVLVVPFTKQRSIFTKRAFYIGIAIAVLIASPNIYWQISNDFPVLTHMAELNENQLENVTIFGFFGGQLLMLLGSFFIGIIGLVYLFLNDQTKPYRLFPIVSLGVLLLLVLANGKDYYAAGIYPFLIAAGSVAVERYANSKVVRIGVLAIILITILPLSPMGIPFMKPQKLANYFDKLESYGFDAGRIHEDGQKHSLPQDYADMMGWYDIANLATEAYEQVEDKTTAAIFGENYGIAGAISLIGKKRGLPEAISFSDTYEYWAPEQFTPDLQTLIYVNDELGSNVEALFDDIKVIGSVTDTLSRQYGVTVYLCQKPNRSFNEFWAEVWEYVRAE